MAVAALVLWLGTAFVGAYLLIQALQAGSPGRADAARARARQPVAVPADPAQPVSVKNRFDPPSLQRAKTETMPGLRDLAEFAHPALAIIGFGFWFGYVVSRDRVFAAIGLGILLGAICAGLSWFTVNRRDAKRAAAARLAGGPGPGEHGAVDHSAVEHGAVDHSAADHGAGEHQPAVLSFTPRLLVLHAVGAAATLLIAVLIVARV